jgi:hypothetical protein
MELRARGNVGSTFVLLASELQELVADEQETIQGITL